MRKYIEFLWAMEQYGMFNSAYEFPVFHEVYLYCMVICVCRGYECDRSLV